MVGYAHRIEASLLQAAYPPLLRLFVTGSAQQEQILLSEISRQAQGAQDNPPRSQGGFGRYKAPGSQRTMATDDSR